MVGIVILNYNTFGDTIRLTNELQHQTIVNDIHIVIVDNASPNDSYAKMKPLEREFSNVVVLQTGENLGYAKGNNYGLEYLERNIHPDYVAIMNNDVWLPDDCLERLCVRYAELENPCVIAPLELDIDGNASFMGDLGSFTDDILMLSLFYNTLNKGKRRQLSDNTGAEAMRVEVIGGSFMFASFAGFKEIGMFYPNTFLYTEERFVAYYAKKAGYYNYVLLNQTYVHAHNSPTISSVYSQLNKYRILYKSRLEYTRVCRKYGALKAAIFYPLTILSLFELRCVGVLKKISLLLNPKSQK